MHFVAPPPLRGERGSIVLDSARNKNAPTAAHRASTTSKTAAATTSAPFVCFMSLPLPHLVLSLSLSQAPRSPACALASARQQRLHPLDQRVPEAAAREGHLGPAVPLGGLQLAQKNGLQVVLVNASVSGDRLGVPLDATAAAAVWGMSERNGFEGNGVIVRRLFLALQIAAVINGAVLACTPHCTHRGVLASFPWAVSAGAACFGCRQ